MSVFDINTGIFRSFRYRREKLPHTQSKRSNSHPVGGAKAEMFLWQPKPRSRESYCHWCRHPIGYMIDLSIHRVLSLHSSPRATYTSRPGRYTQMLPSASKSIT